MGDQEGRKGLSIEEQEEIALEGEAGGEEGPGPETGSSLATPMGAHAVATGGSVSGGDSLGRFALPRGLPKGFKPGTWGIC